MKKIFNKQNNFLFALVGMIVLARIVPYRDEYNTVFNLNRFIDWGICIIFLLYGLKLNIKEVFRDIKNWKLHLLVQLGTFVLFPLLVVLFYPLAKGTEYQLVWLSIFFLASLPSTVSSSVVMVSIAKGNITSAIFNASISGLIGIVATPLLMGFFLGNASTEVNQGEIIQQLLLKVLLPIILGLLLNPLLKKWVDKYNKWIGQFDRFIILLIVYESFSDAFVKRIFLSVSLITFVIIAFASVGLFFVVYAILKRIAQALGFNREDTITATFCGSKKSLVHGSLFVMVLGIPETQKVLYLLPIMLYHSFQLFYVSWLANRIGQQVDKSEKQIK
ncbi:bile acid:sodium symporter family protein [Capnocytophaga sp. G2]|uniref:bile acid:sodium symporter family protein n=1 Tax=Capnocytophaga sp. G2 TaxID=3110695 RepID=UPI002B468179|nr:bile acid:sodium symporter family protein [Capnocytophaga sp. G2]MEB3005413.1 bile acid:sodium symporter family protein [Capnocytophaga sp. G2]